MGSVIGAAYCSGVDPDELRDISAAWRQRDFFQFGLGSPGIGRIERLRRTVARLVPVDDFATFQIPLTVVCTDLNTGEAVPIRAGSVVDAVSASCSIAGVFPPVALNGRMLVDGGYSGPFHVGLAPLDSQVVVFDPSPDASRIIPRRSSGVSLFGGLQLAQAYFIKGIDIIMYRLGRAELAQRPCILVRAPNLGLSALDFSAGARVIDAYYAAAMQAIEPVLRFGELSQADS